MGFFGARSGFRNYELKIEKHIYQYFFLLNFFCSLVLKELITALEKANGKQMFLLMVVCDPFEITISEINSGFIVIKNILIGEVCFRKWTVFFRNTTSFFVKKYIRFT